MTRHAIIDGGGDERRKVVQPTLPSHGQCFAVRGPGAPINGALVRVVVYIEQDVAEEAKMCPDGIAVRAHKVEVALQYAEAQQQVTHAAPGPAALLEHLPSWHPASRI